MMLLLMALFLCSPSPLEACNNSHVTAEWYVNDEAYALVIDLPSERDSWNASLICSNSFGISRSVQPGSFPHSAGNTGYLPVSYPLDVIARVVDSIQSPSGEETTKKFTKADRLTGKLVNQLLPDRVALVAETSRLRTIRKILFPRHSFL